MDGFQFAGISCGIKKNKKKKDLAVITCPGGGKVVGVFTQNQVKAAPVLICQERIKSGRFQALLINSGSANACTGSAGHKDALKTTKYLAKHLAVPEEEVYVCSTGKIGMRLPMEKITSGIDKAVKKLSEKNFEAASEAIMTTDQFPKIMVMELKIQGKKVQVWGMAKGAGMIEPNMATMLAYLGTNLDLPLSKMKSLFKDAVEKSFNRISVDGDQSTNDSAFFMSSQKLKIKGLKESELKSFAKILTEICQNLAEKMVQDGEGATKVVDISVSGARSDNSAKNIAYSVGRSLLVKTAFFGEDPNWGRILAAIGYSGETIDPLKIDIYFDKVKLFRSGQGLGVNAEAKAHKVMKNSQFKVTIHLGLGKGKFSLLTSDLTYDYVKLNSEYST